MFRPIRTKKVYEEVLEQVKNLMAEGVLAPGDRLLPERELADKLQISRASVREAFKVLEVLGLIESKPGGGTVLREPRIVNFIEPLALLLSGDAAGAMETFEVREILEQASAALAAERASEEDLEKIGTILESFRHLDDVERLTRADYEFHYAIAEATHNSVLAKIMNMIADLIEQSMRNARQQQFADPEVAEVLSRQHEEIFAAISARDAKAARRAMYRHLTYSKQQILLLRAKKKEVRYRYMLRSSKGCFCPEK